MMFGAIDMYAADRRMHDLEEMQAQMMARYRKPVERDLLALKQTLDKSDEEEHASIDRVLALLREEQAKRQLTWTDVWNRTWDNTKAKYMTTYALDCALWPPAQLINFSLVPVQYQVRHSATAVSRSGALAAAPRIFARLSHIPPAPRRSQFLYVNALNLAWNFVLSYIFNQDH